MSGKFMMNGIEYLGGGSGGGGNVDDVYVNGESVLDENKIAQVTSYKEVTQAEYEALPDTKLNDGIAYFIKDSTEAEGYPPLIYSLQEREIGVWIDGKPLYQKTYIKTVSASGNVELEDNIDYAQMISSAYYTSADSSVVSPQYIASGSYVNCLVSVDPTTHKMVLINLHSGQLIWVATVQYTKTTDTPGGGLWAGNGALAHHYSTDEYTIGTWIDGKPVYEKAFSVDIQTDGNVWVDTGVTVSDIKNIIKYDLIGIDRYVNGVHANIPGNVRYYNNNIQVYVNFTWYITFKSIILQYTKTTD